MPPCIVAQQYSPCNWLRTTILQTSRLRLRPALGLAASSRGLLPPASTLQFAAYSPSLLSFRVFTNTFCSSSFSDALFSFVYGHSPQLAWQTLDAFQSRPSGCPQMAFRSPSLRQRRGLFGYVFPPGHRRLTASFGSCRFSHNEGTATSSLAVCNPRYRGCLCFSPVGATRFIFGNDKAIRCMGLL